MHIMAGLPCSLDSLFEKNYTNFEKEIEITQTEVLCYSSLSSPMHLQNILKSMKKEEKVNKYEMQMCVCICFTIPHILSLS